MKKKVCKQCQLFVDGTSCPICKKSQFTTNWQGRVYVIDPKNSTIAKTMGLEAKGEYTIKAK